MIFGIKSLINGVLHFSSPNQAQFAQICFTYSPKTGVLQFIQKTLVFLSFF